MPGIPLDSLSSQAYGLPSGVHKYWKNWFVRTNNSDQQRIKRSWAGLIISKFLTARSVKNAFSQPSLKCNFMKDVNLMRVGHPIKPTVLKPQKESRTWTKARWSVAMATIKVKWWSLASVRHLKRGPVPSVGLPVIQWSSPCSNNNLSGKY